MVKPLARGDLVELTEARLDAYRKRLLRLEESPDESDLSPDEVSALDPAYIHFKSDPRYIDTLATVIDLLAKRRQGS